MRTGKRTTIYIILIRQLQRQVSGGFPDADLYCPQVQTLTDSLLIQLIDAG